jgi:hypothetical protein
MHPDLVEYGPVRFHSDPNALYERHLIFDYAIDPDMATPRERYEAVARSLRDVLALRWRAPRRIISPPTPSMPITSRWSSSSGAPWRVMFPTGYPLDSPNPNLLWHPLCGFCATD